MIYFFRPVWWVFLGPQRPQRQFPVMNPWEEIHFDLPVLRLQTIPWPSLAHYLPSMNRYVSTKFAPNKNLRVSFLLPIHTVSKVYFLSKNSKSFFVTFYARWNHHKSFKLQVAAPLTFWVPYIFQAWNFCGDFNAFQRRWNHWKSLSRKGAN